MSHKFAYDEVFLRKSWPSCRVQWYNTYTTNRTLYSNS